MKGAHNTVSALKVSYSLCAKKFNCKNGVDYASHFIIKTFKSMILFK